MALKDNVVGLGPNYVYDRSSEGDQIDLKINDLRTDLRTVCDAADALILSNSGQGLSEVVADSTSPATATAGKGIVLGSSTEGAVTQLAVAAMAIRVQVAGVAYNSAGKRIVIPTSTSVTVTAADATNDRKDIVVVTSAGALAVRAGTPAGSPADPTLTAGDVPLARLAVAANATTVVTGNITDLRSRDYINGQLLIPLSVGTGELASAAVTTAKIAAGAVTATELGAAAVTQAKAKVFISTEITANGMAQSTAHGLGTAPTSVLIVPTNLDGSAYAVTEGTHTSTNVVVTVTSGDKYKILAWV